MDPASRIDLVFVAGRLRRSRALGPADAGSEAVIRSTRSTPRADRRMKPARAPGRPCRDLAPRGAGESGSLVRPTPSLQSSAARGLISHRSRLPNLEPNRHTRNPRPAHTWRRRCCAVETTTSSSVRRFVPPTSSSSTTSVPARVRCDGPTRLGNEMTRPDPSPVLARRPPPDAPHVALPRTPFADDEDGDDIDGEGFAFALPDIDALIAGPLPSLGPDDLTFIATIDDLDKLPTATPASSAPPTSPGGMLSSPRSSFPPGAFSFATSSRAGCPDGAAERAGLAPWVPRWSVDESVHPGRPTGGVPPPAAAARPPPAAPVLDDERGAMRAACLTFRPRFSRRERRRRRW